VEDAQSKPRAKWYKRKWVWILAGVLLLIVAASASSTKQTNPQSPPPTEKPTTADTQKKAEVAKIGQPARDGKFEFTVKGVECGKSTVGTSPATRQAQGQFCFLTVHVKNIGTEQQSLFSANQKLLDDQKTQYSPDDTATAYVSSAGATWFSQINPGNSVEGVMVFDVPKNATPASAELHDSTYSGGVAVNLK